MKTESGAADGAHPMKKDRLITGCVMVFALGAASVHGETPSTTRAHLTNPNGFVNSGTVRLRPRSSASDPPPTSIVVDTTLNPMSSGSITGTPISGQSGDLYTIGPNYGVTAGNNEFLSFSTFNVGSGDTANFAVPSSSIANIISRVTGGATSTIAGTVETTISGSATASNASFWFINPSGVILTAGAQINVTGALSLGAADFIAFADGTQFFGSPANGATPPVLTSANPASFGFLSTPTAGALTITGATLSLVSGTPLMLGAGSGGISLTGATLSTSAIASQLSPLATEIAIDTLGPVQITGGTAITTYALGGGAAGAITVNGSSILMTGSSITTSADYGATTGSISLTATGLNPSSPWALQVSGGSGLVETVANDPNHLGSVAGAINITATEGAVEIGAPGDSTPTMISISPPFGGNFSGSIAVSGSSVTLDQAQLLALTGSTLSGSPSGPAVSISSSSGPVTITGGSIINTNTDAGANASNINITGPSILVNGGSEITASSGPPNIFASQTGSAGNITLTATGTDPNGGYALEVSGASSILSDATQGVGTAATAGSITLSATNGTVQIGRSSDLAPTLISTSAGASAGSVGAILIGGAAIGMLNADLDTSAAGNAASLATASPGAITLTASGALTIAGSDLNASSSGSQAGGNINATASTIAVSNSQISAATTGVGNAGSITLTATGANQGSVPALQVTGGSTLSSDASEGESGANAGSVILTASGGSIQIGLATDSTQTSISTSAGVSAGEVGSITINGSGIALANANVATTAAGTEQALESASPGTITLTANNAPLTVANSAINASTVAVQQGGQIFASGSQLGISNSQITAATNGTANAGQVSLVASGPDTPGSPALLVAGGSIISSDAYAGQSLANAGTVSLTASAGTIQIGLATDSAPTQLLSRAGANAGAVGSISVTGASIALDQAELFALSQSSVSPSASQPAVSVTATGPVSFVASVLNSNTSGSANSGNISVSGSTVSMSGSSPLTGLAYIDAATFGVGNAGNIMVKATGADPAGGAALQLSGGSSISSQSELAAGNAGPGGNAGSITLIANGGTVEIESTSTRTSLSTLASANAGGAGAISITANQIEFNLALIDTTVSTTNTPSNLTPASVSLTATGSVSMIDSLIDLQTSGTVNAGSVSINGGSVSISGGLALAPVPNSPFSLAENAAIFTGSSGSGNGGSVSISSAGPLTISNATISSQSVGNTGYGGQIALAGAGVLISQQSLIAADYRNPGGNPGAAGTITISSTGIEASNDPLQAELTSATPGVVRIVDSGVTASNDGGTGSNGSIGSFGQVLIGLASPGQISSGSVVIAGSVISTDVLDSGLGNNLTIAANNGVYIGASTTGGFADPIARPTFPDPRANIESSLISAQTDSTAVSGGQIAISAGAGGIDVVNSNIEAGTTRTVSGIVIDDFSSGAVMLNDASLQSGTSGMNRSGDITLSGPMIGIVGGTITAKTTGLGAAGNITLTASGADPQGGAALQVSGGATVTSDAVSGQNGAKAGNVALSAASGSVQIGLSNDAQPTLISTSAGAAAGQAGSVTITGSEIKLDNANLDTTAAGTAAALSSAPPATITLSAGNGSGPLTIANSSLDATTSGAQQAGQIDLSGAAVAISNTNIASATTSGSNAGSINIDAATLSMTGSQVAVSTSGSGNAGDIGITASGADPAGGNAIQIQGTSIESAATGSASSAAGAAGTITIQASGGSVSLGSAAAGAPATQVETSANAFATQAGVISVASAGALTLQNTAVTASVAGSNAGATPANIVLSARGPIAMSGGSINADTTAAAAGGAIQLLTAGAITVSGAAAISSNTSSTGKGGDIDVGTAAAPVGSLLVSGGSTISVDASGSGATAGNAGAINIHSTGPVTLSSTRTKLSSDSSNDATGGSVTIDASSLSMTGGAQITANTSSTVEGAGASADNARAASRLSARPAAGAPTATTGGSVGVTTSGTVALAGAGTAISANAAGSGSGGTVTITAARLAMSDGAEIATTALGAGNSGTIAITLTPAVAAGAAAPDVLADSQITTNAAASTGGNITIDAGGLPLTLIHTDIVASAEGAGNAGNITINDAGQTLLQASGILGEAVSGNGGAISIFLNKGALFVEDSESLVSAQSQTGNDGTVTIGAPQVNLNSALTAPDVHATRAPELASNACRRDSARSTFVREGRGGVAPAPDAYLNSSAATPAPATAKDAVTALPEPPLPLLAALSGDKGCE